MTITGEPDSFDEILANYLDQLDNGEPVQREALLLKHPDLADQLARFFDDCDAVSQVVRGIDDDDLLVDKQWSKASWVGREESGPKCDVGARLAGEASGDAG